MKYTTIWIPVSYAGIVAHSEGKVDSGTQTDQIENSGLDLILAIEKVENRTQIDEIMGNSSMVLIEATKKSIRNYQESQKETEGTVGPSTMKKVIGASKDTPLVFTEATKNKIKSYQESQIESEVIVGPSTMKEVIGAAEDTQLKNLIFFNFCAYRFRINSKTLKEEIVQLFNRKFLAKVINKPNLNTADIKSVTHLASTRIVKPILIKFSSSHHREMNSISSLQQVGLNLSPNNREMILRANYILNKYALWAEPDPKETIPKKEIEPKPAKEDKSQKETEGTVRPSTMKRVIGAAEDTPLALTEAIKNKIKSYQKSQIESEVIVGPSIMKVIGAAEDT